MKKYSIKITRFQCPWTWSIPELVAFLVALTDSLPATRADPLTHATASRSVGGARVRERQAVPWHFETEAVARQGRAREEGDQSSEGLQSNLSRSCLPCFQPLFYARSLL